MQNKLMISIGELAPDFTLVNTDKQEVKLSTLVGQPIVLLFFPLAFTGTCTAELCTMRDNISYYTDLKAKVLGISVDSLFALKRFKEEQKLNFDLLSDFNKTASASYNTLYEEFIFGMKGVSKRSAFVIDKSGIIRYMEILEVAAEQPSYEKINACLASLK